MFHTVYVMISPFVVSIGSCISVTYILGRALKPTIVVLCNKYYDGRDLQCWYLQRKHRGGSK